MKEPVAAAICAEYSIGGEAAPIFMKLMRITVFRKAENVVI
jgi:hypothetical protein